jgi:hypothetical protein
MLLLIIRFVEIESVYKKPTESYYEPVSSNPDLKAAAIK